MTYLVCTGLVMKTITFDLLVTWGLCLDNFELRTYVGPSDRRFCFIVIRDNLYSLGLRMLYYKLYRYFIKSQ